MLKLNIPEVKVTACVAFPHLRVEHVAKDVFQLPVAIFQENICFIARKCDPNVHVSSLKIVDKGGNGDKFSFREAISVAAVCAQYRYVILFHISYVTIFIAMLARVFHFLRYFRKNKIILQSDFGPTYEEKYNKKNIGAMRFIFAISRLITKYSFDIVCVASNQGCSFLQKKMGIPFDRIFKVYNCPDFPSEKLKANRCLDGRQNTVLFIGRKDDPLKNVQGIIDAFEIVSRTRRDWRLDLVGPGTSRQSSSASELIIEIGPLFSRSDVLKKYIQSKIFLLPSFSEGASLAFAEALVNGCYPVSTDVGNFSELMEKVNAGIIVSPDPESIATGILAAIEKVESEPLIHLRISDTAYFLNWESQVAKVRERLCLS